MAATYGQQTLGLWKLDALVGTDVAEHGEMLPGVADGADLPTVVAAVEGNGFEFAEGMDDGVHGDVGLGVGVKAVAGLRITCFIKATIPLAAAGFDGLRGIFTILDENEVDSGLIRGELFGLYLQEDGYIRVRWCSDGGLGEVQELVSDTAIPSDTWVEVSATRLDNDVHSCFISFDGMAAGAATLPPPQWTPGDNIHWYIGRGIAGGSDSTPFTGAIDDVHVEVVPEEAAAAPPAQPMAATGPAPQFNSELTAGTVDFGRDVGTFPELDGALKERDEVSLLGEAILRRLTTPRGTLAFHEDYGTDIRAYLNEAVTDDLLSRIKDGVEVEVLQDERFEAVTASPSYAPSTRTLTLEVEVTVADGPFTFTISVTQLTAVLLSTEEG